MMPPFEHDSTVVTATLDVVTAYLSRHPVASADLPKLVTSVHGTLAALGRAPEPTPVKAKPKPAVSVRASVAHDHIVCLENGQRFKSLKRHLMTAYGLTPDQYRAKWGLASDYPMVAPAYAATRAVMAKAVGFGRRRAPV